MGSAAPRPNHRIHESLLDLSDSTRTHRRDGRHQGSQLCSPCPRDPTEPERIRLKTAECQALLNRRVTRQWAVLGGLPALRHVWSAAVSQAEFGSSFSRSKMNWRKNATECSLPFSPPSSRSSLTCTYETLRTDKPYPVLPILILLLSGNASSTCALGCRQ
jgi:hypothetical protein